MDILLYFWTRPWSSGDIMFFGVCARVCLVAETRWKLTREPEGREQSLSTDNWEEEGLGKKEGRTRGEVELPLLVPAAHY